MSKNHFEAYEASLEIAARIEAMVELAKENGVAADPSIVGADDDLGLAALIVRLRAENEALRNQVVYWHALPGIGLIRCVPDARYRKFAPGIRMLYSPVLMVPDEEQRKDAERYRWFRNHSLQIVHASTGPWVHNLDKVIDEEMAKADVFDVPLMCRQRMAASGLPYPRSSCYSCGQFSPSWRECDQRITAHLRKDSSE